MARQRSIESILASEYISIGELAKLTGYRYSTLKYYVEEGLLPFEQEEERLTRRFLRESSIDRLDEIMKLKKEGHSISVIKSLI